MSALPRTYRYLLLLSLALNLGLGAALFTAQWHHQQSRQEGTSDRRWARIPNPRMLAGALDDLTVPTLLLTGDADTVVPTADTERLSTLLPSAELVVIERAGHLPHEERAAVVLDALLSWAREVLA